VLRVGRPACHRSRRGKIIEAVAHLALDRRERLAVGGDAQRDVIVRVLRDETYPRLVARKLSDWKPWVPIRKIIVSAVGATHASPASRYLECGSLLPLLRREACLAA